MTSFGSPTDKTADAEAGQIELRHFLCAFNAQIGIKRALNDAEQRLIFAAFSPSCSDQASAACGALRLSRGRNRTDTASIHRTAS